MKFWIEDESGTKMCIELDSEIKMIKFPGESYGEQLPANRNDQAYIDGCSTYRKAVEKAWKLLGMNQ